MNITALNIGVAVDGAANISRFENVHIVVKYWLTAMGWSWGPPTSGHLGDVIGYTITNLVGFKFGHTDWQQLNGCFVIWSRIGMEFDMGADGNPPSVSLVNSGVDVSQTALLITAAEPWIGLQFTNCNFVGATVIAGTTIGPVKFNNCGFNVGYAPENPNRNKVTALIYGTSESTLTFTDCLFQNWDTANTGAGAITLNSGVGILTACEFLKQPGKRHFNLYNDANLRVIGTRFGHPLIWGNVGTGTGEFVANVGQQ